MEQQFFSILVSLVAVVFVFLFAVKKFSNQVQHLFGDKFKNLLERFTNTPLKGVLVGAGLTSIIQSSTAVTVLLVSLVDAGVLSFTNSIGVIIGSNIGTTLTTQLIAFKVLNIAPYILILGFLLMNINHRYNKFQYLGKPIFYFGLIFSCLFIISVFADIFRDSTMLLSLISKTSNLFVAIGVGIVVTTVLQSSSIATSLIVIFAGGGLLTFAQAFGIILGTNIGTTTTALLASTVTGKQGKRVAMMHFIFNFAGVIIFLPFVGLFSDIISRINTGLVGQIAISHLVFNIIIATLFLFIIKPVSKLIHKIIP
ncbi:MAG: Na/Pi symporter [Candidatus Pacebacteria bacterium]|nr:Na/Pi symporter [Candidatus Paceibacterota bacterium]MCF7862806.1 Na/Pi symporter [Candidatus Paceibacterota bacterium]